MKSLTLKLLKNPSFSENLILPLGIFYTNSSIQVEFYTGSPLLHKQFYTGSPLLHKQFYSGSPLLHKQFYTGRVLYKQPFSTQTVQYVNQYKHFCDSNMSVKLSGTHINLLYCTIYVNICKCFSRGPQGRLDMPNCATSINYLFIVVIFIINQTSRDQKPKRVKISYTDNIFVCLFVFFCTVYLSVSLCLSLSLSLFLCYFEMIFHLGGNKE